MCGIAGAIAVRGELDPAIRHAIRPMTAALRHRGPDGHDVFSDAYAALGHARLAIIDRAGGTQPMTNEDGSCWIVFNGEIYNHRALRQQLERRGHVFRSSSDTEVIVHAYEEFGSECVSRLEGMFAFAIYDRRRRELFAARDRLGKKPLFYAVLGGALHFASEIKSIALSPAWNDSLDLGEIAGYLSLGYVLAPRTIFKHVHKLEPGHWLRLAGARIVTYKYWDVEEFDTHVGSDAEIVAELESVVGAAVRERLESEVPLGAFLSGGIDSGLVVSFMADGAHRPVQTTTVGFSDGGHNELAAARLTADAFQTEHHEDILEPHLADVLDPIVRAFDEPFADASAIPTYYLSAMARRRVTVALSGDGGDEGFCGYDFRYVPHAVEAAIRPWVHAAGGRRAASWIGRRWPRAAWMPRPLRAGTLLQNIAGNDADAYYADLCFLKPSDTRRLLGQDAGHDVTDTPAYQRVTEPYRRCRSTDAVQRAEYADLKVYLPNDVLVKVDRMSMQHGLEVRCPLLDRRVIELAFRIPAHRKFKLRQSKYFLRQLARRRLPRALTGMPKRGFSAPVRRWIADAHAADFEREVLASNSAVATIVDLDRTRAMFREHVAGERDHAYALWALWVLERWCRLRGAARREATTAMTTQTSAAAPDAVAAATR
jgi:asparagine synthase (glutamine-hydrolysing)